VLLDVGEAAHDEAYALARGALQEAPMHHDLLHQLRGALQAAGSPARAVKQQAYMKSAMPYWGVDMTTCRRIARDAVRAWPVVNARAWTRDVRALWRGATHREERYAALELCADKRARGFLTADALPLAEELIVTGAWWDLVDELASHMVGTMLAQDPVPMKKALRAWSKDKDLWKRRTSIIAQLGAKKATDTALLEQCIAPNLADESFWLRKAIGWSLRQYARTDPAWVKRYVKAHQDALSGLSKREALKHL
jgi:3-methyladenine DNA glycosylase AlkD